MSVSRDLPGIQDEIDRLRYSRFRSLGFGQRLEDRFERDTARDRSHRLWFEGLLAIIALNGCLVVDLLLVRDVGWQSIVLRTMLVSPLALLVNALVRRNPKGWIREGSVALGTTLICFINMYADGNGTAATSTYGLMCVLITVLFADVLMRLRLPYAAGATGAMTAGGLWFLAHASGLQTSEKIVGASLLMVGVAITMTASYSLEREERLAYLLHLRGEMQGQELGAVNAELHELSRRDQLTGLPNRRAFEERFEQVWMDCERLQMPLGAIVVDVDHFKVLNDVYGHLYGDKVLQRIASLLPQGLRCQGDWTARFGGEEFVILLPNTELNEAVTVAERVRSLIELAGTPGWEQTGGEALMWTTISCGVAVSVPLEETERDDLLRAADRALYDAKAGGRNQVRHQVLVDVMASSGRP